MIRPRSKESLLRLVLTLTGDFLIGGAAMAAAVYVRSTIPLSFTRSLLPPGRLPVDLATVLLFAGSFIAALAVSGFYRRRIMPRERPMLAAALVIQVALVSIGATFGEQPLPRTILVFVLLIEAVLLPLWRGLLGMALPIRPRETILVGEAAQIDAALAGLAAASDQRVRVAGWAGPPGFAKIMYLGETTDRDVQERLNKVEEVIYVDPEASPRSRLELLRIRGPRGYLLLASHADALLTSAMLGWVGDQPLIEITVGCGYGIRAAIKRTMDIALGGALALLAVPFAAIAAIAIWLDDRGPVLIRQMRVGRGSVPFPMWKFRSMNVPTPGSVDGEHITRVGAFLRRYRIDELPQLINVVVGDMSLVGPRPERPEIVAQILDELPEFELRCLVRPGIAGLAQVSAKANTHPEVKLRYDLTYMCDWSLRLDLRLLFSSLSASISGSGS
jgi:lipopolysaccharide/colanic/teichoic acid biosynthesis glycosyltransferase